MKDILLQIKRANVSSIASANMRRQPQQQDIRSKKKQLLDRINELQTMSSKKTITSSKHVFGNAKQNPLTKVPQISNAIDMTPKIMACS